MKVHRSGLFLVFVALSISTSWAQTTITNGQVVSVPVSQTRVNVAVDRSGNPILLTGSPTALELAGNFSQLGQPIYDPETGSAPGPYIPFAGNLIPASRVDPGGTFTSIGGTAYIGTNQTVTVDGAGSAWTIGSALTVGSVGTLTLTNAGVVAVGTVSGSMSNAGTVSIHNGSSLSISQNGLFTGSGSPGYVQTAGDTKVDGVLNASVSILGGQFGGSGIVNGAFSMAPQWLRAIPKP